MNLLELIRQLLPEVVEHIDELDRVTSDPLARATVIESALHFALELLVKRGQLVVETTGQLTIIAHKGAHPSDV